MKPTKTHLLTLGLAAAGLATSSLSAQSFTEDFETDLSQFTFIDSSGGTNSATIVSNGSNVANIDANSQGVTNFPGAMITATGFSVDATSDFSGSFDVYINDTGSFGDAMFMFGDIGTAVNNGNYYGVIINNHQPSGDVFQYNGGSRTEVVSNWHDTDLASQTWYTASFDWTAATNTMSLSLTAQGGGATLASFSDTFALTTVEFGWGSLNDAGQFDNISIIPEPGNFALIGGACALMLLGARRRK